MSLEFHAGQQFGMVTNNGTDNLQYTAAVKDRLLPLATSDTQGAFRNGSKTARPYADFEQSYDAINGYVQDDTASPYTINEGDTLQSIALAVWGDSSLWYLIADANGLTGSSQLVQGQSISLPNKIRNNRNSADTFRPYDPNEALGNLSPTSPKSPKKPKCGVLGQIISVIVAAVTSQFGILGNVVSQGVNMLLGIQDKFSWKSLGMAAITSTLQAFTPPGMSGLAAFAFNVGTNIVAQGIGVVTGLQKKFDWASVAGSAISSGMQLGLSSANLPSFSLKHPTFEGFAASLGTKAFTSVFKAAARSVIDGTSFGDNIMAELPQVIGGTIGGAISDRLDDWLRSKMARGAGEPSITVSGASAGSPASASTGVSPVLANSQLVSAGGPSLEALAQSVRSLPGPNANDPDGDDNAIIVTGTRMTPEQMAAYDRRQRIRMAQDDRAYINRRAHRARGGQPSYDYRRTGTPNTDFSTTWEPPVRTISPPETVPATSSGGISPIVRFAVRGSGYGTAAAILLTPSGGPSPHEYELFSAATGERYRDIIHRVGGGSASSYLTIDGTITGGLNMVIRQTPGELLDIPGEFISSNGRIIEEANGGGGNFVVMHNNPDSEMTEGWVISIESPDEFEIAQNLIGQRLHPREINSRILLHRNQIGYRQEFSIESLGNGSAFTNPMIPLLGPIADRPVDPEDRNERPDAVRVIENGRRGNQFERATIDGIFRPLGIQKNTRIESVILAGPENRLINTIYDVDNRIIGSVEIKDVVHLSNSNQLRAQAQAAIARGYPYSVIVSGRNETITAPLREMVLETGGGIYRYDPDYDRLETIYAPRR